MHRRYLQCGPVLFLLLFLTQTVCLHHLWDVNLTHHHKFSYSLVHLFKFLPSLLQDLSRVSYLCIGGGEIALAFIPLMRFLLYTLVSSSFHVYLWYLFVIFSFISACLMVSASYISKYFKVFFPLSILFFVWFGSSIPSVMCCFPLLISMVHFLCQIPSLGRNCIFSLPVLGFPILFYFWQKVWCRP